MDYDCLDLIAFCWGGGVDLRAHMEGGSAKCVLERARGEGGSKKAKKLRAYLMYAPYVCLWEGVGPNGQFGWISQLGWIRISMSKGPRAYSLLFSPIFVHHLQTHLPDF